MFGDPGDLSYRITSIAIIVPLALACNGPVLGFGALGAFLGYLPFLALSRLLICFEEAKQMALVIRRRVAGLPEAKPKNFYSRYLSLWTRPQAQLCAWIAEGLVSWLYRRPINLPEQSTTQSG